MFEILNLTGWPVAGQNDLFVPFVEGIERVEELFLNALFAGEKLDVVDQKDVGLTILFAEFDQLIVLNAIDVFVCKFFRRDIGDTRSLFIGGDMMANSMEQMCFSQADPAIKEKRIVGFAGGLRNCEGCGVGKVVVVADDKSVECVFRIEDRFLRRKRSFSRRFDRFYFYWIVIGVRGGWSIGANLKFDLQLLARSDRDNVLKQAHIVVFEPDFAKIIGDFKEEGVVILAGSAQRSEPEIISVRAQH